MTPSHFVAFTGDGGHLATARDGDTVVKFWPPPCPESKIITSPNARISVTEKPGRIQGYHYN